MINLDLTPAEEQIDASLENLDLEPLAKDRRLNGLNLGVSTLMAGFARTVEGASTVTLTVQDPEWALLDSGLFDVNRDGRFSTPIEVRLDKLWFRLVKIIPGTSSIQLVFQDREISLLEEATKNIVVARGKTQLPEYAQRLITSVHDHKQRLRCYIPELHEKQAIAKAQGSSARAQRHAAKARGLPRGMQLKGWDGETHTLTSTETKDAEIACEAAEGAPEKAALALLEAAIVEAPFFANPKTGDSTSVGMLQLLDTHLGGSSSTHGGRRDVRRVCELFLLEGFAGEGGAIALARKHPSWSPGQIAQHVQGSAFPERYDEVRSSAQKVLDAWRRGGGRRNGNGDVTVIKPYLYKVTGNYWKTLTGYAQPVNWRVFVVNGVVYFISEERLFEARSRFTISRDHPAVLDVSVSEWDTRKELAEFSFESRASLWPFPPGCVGTVEKSGTLNGSWLVHSIEQPDLADERIKVTLTKPILKEPEPAPETESRSSAQAGDSTITVPSNHPLLEAGVKEMVEIDRANYRYVYGGGHGTFEGPYDCSGAISAVLHAMGLLSEPETTAGLSTWGQPGNGKYLTIWVKETGDPMTSHTFATATIGGQTHYFEAGGAESDHTGWHKPRSTAGFSPRHWPGL